MREIEICQVKCHKSELSYDGELMNHKVKMYLKLEPKYQLIGYPLDGDINVEYFEVIFSRWQHFKGDLQIRRKRRKNTEKENGNMKNK